MKKGEIREGTVERVEYPDQGKIFVPEEDRSVTVKHAIPGQKVRYRVLKPKKGEAQGKILEVLQSSPLEKREPVCSLFPECGGCTYQTMTYEDQLQMKSDQIREILDRAIVDKTEYTFEGIYPSPQEFGYRNKMEFSFGDSVKDGPLALGLHRKDSNFDVLTASDCQLVHQDMTAILSCVLSYFQKKGIGYYKKMEHIGYLRHLMLRRSDTTGDLLVCLVTTTQEDHDLTDLVNELLSLSLKGKIVGFLHILNDSLSDVVQSDETKILYGQDYFYETLMGLEFKVTPFSFFQPNSKGAEVLYNLVRSDIGDIEEKTVFDLYSGTGTIAQMLAPKAKQVIGIEIVPEAVEDAKENAKRNGLTNCQFIEGDVLSVLQKLDQKPDAIVLDPPREGVHPKALAKILDYQVETMVYVSCKATSMARDLKLIQEKGYKVIKAAAVDQFCDTVHTESVLLLSKEGD